MSRSTESTTVGYFRARPGSISSLRCREIFEPANPLPRKLKCLVFCAFIPSKSGTGMYSVISIFGAGTGCGVGGGVGAVFGVHQNCHYPRDGTSVPLRIEAGTTTTIPSAASGNGTVTVYTSLAAGAGVVQMVLAVGGHFQPRGAAGAALHGQHDLVAGAAHHRNVGSAACVASTVGEPAGLTARAGAAGSASPTSTVDVASAVVSAARKALFFNSPTLIERSRWNGSAGTRQASVCSPTADFSYQAVVLSLFPL
jgi:hypothetical protein